MAKQIFRMLRVAVLALVPAVVASQAFAQDPGAPIGYAPTYWYYNVYPAPIYRMGGPGYVPNYMGREAWYQSSYPRSTWSPSGYITSDGTYQSGMFPRTRPYGWW